MNTEQPNRFTMWVSLGAEAITELPASQKRPDVHKIVLSIKIAFPPPPPPEKVSIFEDFLLICTVFPRFGPFSKGKGVKPNFAHKNFMDTQTFLNFVLAAEVWISAGT